MATLSFVVMPTLPRLPLRLPSSVDTFSTFVNGRRVLTGDPAPELVRDPGDRRGSLLIPCSYGMQALHLHARASGWEMKTTGRGRPLARQTAAFLERMTPTYDPAVNTQEDSRTVVLDQRDIHPQLIPGRRWYKRRGVAAVASPGTSNHGFRSADDTALELDGDPDAEGVTEAFIRWLIPLAHQFGWTWELQSEPWHLSWIAGDDIPPLAQAILKKNGIPFPGGSIVADKFEFTQRRLYDSRDDLTNGKVGPEPLTLPVLNLPENVIGLGLNVTVTETEQAGWVAIWPDGEHPGTSLQNWTGPGATVANYTNVALGPGDTFMIMVGGGGGEAHVIIDIVGHWLS